MSVIMRWLVNQAARRRVSLVCTYVLAALVMIYLSYALPGLLPGDFLTTMYSGSEVTLSAVQLSEVGAGYQDREGFGRYLARLVTLDWGYSRASHLPVAQLFFSALPWTLLLLGTAHVLATSLGFFLGVEAAWRRDTWWERGMVGIMTILEGVPEICTGVILLLLFALHWQWFPAGGAETAYAELGLFARLFDVAHHLALPLATLVLAHLPGNFLLARNSMVMIIKQSYISTARAKGLSALRIRYVHAARNALLPLATKFCLRFAFMVTGALVVERIHSYPGLGTLLFTAIQTRDLPVIQAVVLVSSLLVLAIILALELLYRFIDPRIECA